jgi:hypothetical protein
MLLTQVNEKDALGWCSEESGCRKWGGSSSDVWLSKSTVSPLRGGRRSLRP